MHETNPILESALSGSDEALRALVHRYHDRVYRFGKKVCANDFEAQDAVQSAFIVLARRPDLQGSPSVLSWLFQVVRNACLAALQRVSGRRTVSLSAAPEGLDVPDDALSPEAAVERFELVSRVYDAIARLPADERDAVLLRDLEGLSGPEAAARLGISEAALKSRLHRGRLGVRRHVTEPRRPGAE